MQFSIAPVPLIFPKYCRSCSSGISQGAEDVSCHHSLGVFAVLDILFTERRGLHSPRVLGSSNILNQGSLDVSR